MIIRKRYESAFVVEKSKLTRLLAVIKTALHHEGGFYRESFQARLAGAKGLTTDDIQHIFELDNSGELYT
jgi:ribose 1,5-bisphosphokinase PhnN